MPGPLELALLPGLTWTVLALSRRFQIEWQEEWNEFLGGLGVALMRIAWGEKSGWLATWLRSTGYSKLSGIGAVKTEEYMILYFQGSQGLDSSWGDERCLWDCDILA